MSAEEKPPASSRAMRWLGALYPLVAAYLVLTTLYAWQTTKHLTPWLFVDELQWGRLSQAIAHTGHPELRLHRVAFDSLYAYFIAPAWWLGATGRAYAAAKYLNVAVVAATVFPAYGLARHFVPRIPAILCGVAAAVIPSVAYADLLIPEPLAYFWSTLVLWLVARALLRPRTSTVAAAIAALAAAPAMRAELAVLVPAAFIAAVVMIASSPSGRSRIASWTTREKIGAVALSLLLAIWAGGLMTHHSYSWQLGTYYHHRMLEYGLWAAGALAIGLGVVPVFATLAWMLNARLREPGERALFGLTLGAVMAFGAYTAVKASYISATFAIRVEERNLIYVSPLLFVVTARWAIAGRTRVLPGLLAAGGVAYLLGTTPYHNNEHLYSDALGLAILQWLNRTWAFTTTDARWLLYGILIGTVVASAAREVVVSRTGAGVRRLVGIAAGSTLAVLCITWNLTGEIVAADASNSFSKTFRTLVVTPPDWIDRETGRARTMYIGEAFGDPNAFWTLEFWNQSIEDVWSVDATAPGPGPVVTPDFASTDGQVAPQLPLDWAVASPAIELSGRIVENAGGLALYRLTHPIRMVSEYGGVFSDGWMGTAAWYTRFGAPGDPPGRLSVILTRKAACGTLPPVVMTVRVSKLLINSSAQPVAGPLEAIRHVTVRSNPCDRIVVPLSATPPFRVDVTAASTFQPSVSDLRRLSVQAGFGFTPGTG